MDDRTPAPDDSRLARYAARNDALRARVEALPPPVREFARNWFPAVALGGRCSEYGSLPQLERFVEELEHAVIEHGWQVALEYGRHAGEFQRGSGT